MLRRDALAHGGLTYNWDSRLRLSFFWGRTVKAKTEVYAKGPTGLFRSSMMTGQDELKFPMSGYMAEVQYFVSDHVAVRATLWGAGVHEKPGSVWITDGSRDTEVPAWGYHELSLILLSVGYDFAGLFEH